jgi:hypothetical protein
LEGESLAKNPMAVFKYALKAPESKRQYPRRFKVFLDFLKIPEDLEMYEFKDQNFKLITK